MRHLHVRRPDTNQDRLLFQHQPESVALNSILMRLCMVALRSQRAPPVPTCLLIHIMSIGTTNSSLALHMLYLAPRLVFPPLNSSPLSKSIGIDVAARLGNWSIGFETLRLWQSTSNTPKLSVSANIALIL
jgi:hypothetical protein